MAGPTNSRTEDDLSPPNAVDSSLDVPPDISWYTLRFEFVRLEAYCASEASFYSFLSNAVAVLAAISGTSAIATIFAQLYPLNVILTTISVTLSAVNQVAKFNDRYRFYNELRSKYSKWRDELERNEHNDKQLKPLIKKNYNAMRKLEDERPYGVHWALDALSWNDAYYQTRPLETIKPSELLEVWFCEQLVMHVIPFSREHFLSRQHNDWFKKNRMWIGPGMVMAAVIIGVLPFVFWNQLRSTGFIFGVLPLALLLSLILIDAGYHKLKGALSELGVNPPPAANRESGAG